MTLSRWKRTGRQVTDDYLGVDVRVWQRDGLLKPLLVFRWTWTLEGDVIAAVDVRTAPGRVVLDYRRRARSEGWRDESCQVDLTWTDCPFGGSRPWFVCPTCNGRVAILYLAPTIACRRCLNLAYASQRELPYDRAARRAERIRSRMGWPGGILTGPGPRPKGMHRITYFRRMDEHHEFAMAAASGAVAKFTADPERAKVCWK